MQKENRSGQRDGIRYSTDPPPSVWLIGYTLRGDISHGFPEWFAKRFGGSQELKW